jgi:phosphoacetylglucosamine mutase
MDDWHDIYTDLPSKQLKVPVARKDHIICASDEMTVVEPAALQQALNDAMATCGSMSRCFVRPSGTENVVRVYAESSTKEQADSLAAACVSILSKFV